MLQAKIDSILASNEQRVILARRPYPPVGLTTVCSQLGGLPLLPSDKSWPRTTDGIPLHFIARIDCSELPEERGLLPDTGVLQFFARIDEEMLWDGDASEYSRVLFSEDIPNEQAVPPADLPPLMDGWCRWDREMRLPGEPETQIYPRWQLMFGSIRTWSKNIALDPGIGVSYSDFADAVDRARAAEIVRTTGWPTNPILKPTWAEYVFNTEGQRIVTLPEDDFKTSKFPQAWIIGERIARAMKCLADDAVGKIRKDIEHGNEPKEGVEPEKLLEDIERIASQSLSWVRRAQAAGLDAPMGEVEAKEYVKWLTPLSCDNRFEISYIVLKSLERGMSSAIKYCGHSHKADAVVPVSYMNRLEGQHSLTSTDTLGILVDPPRRRVWASHHRMLGDAPTSQDVGTRMSKNILLLHLVSDPGVDFMFCDCGEIQFWIDADDLIARNFDRARANTQGG